MSTVARLYDDLAPQYEQQLAENPVAQYMRSVLQLHIAHVFRPGDHVLDLTAGTGVDACFLASRGIQVTAMDISQGMIAELEQVAQHRGLSVRTLVAPVEDLSRLSLSGLDGVISTFGGLNTVSGMSQLARDVASCLRPGGRVILHALNDFCFWQTVRGIKRGKFKFAREPDIHIGSTVISLQFYNPIALWRDSFSSRFALKQVYGLSVIAAPPLVLRFPRYARPLFALDRIAGHFFPLAGDFFVLDLERRDV